MKSASCRNDVASERHCRRPRAASTCSFGLLLNISSIRSVTRKPPTTLIVPKTIAIDEQQLVERSRRRRGRAR